MKSTGNLAGPYMCGEEYRYSRVRFYLKTRDEYRYSRGRLYLSFPWVWAFLGFDSCFLCDVSFLFFQMRIVTNRNHMKCVCASFILLLGINDANVTQYKCFQKWLWNQMQGVHVESDDGIQGDYRWEKWALLRRLPSIALLHGPRTDQHPLILESSKRKNEKKWVPEGKAYLVIGHGILAGKYLAKISRFAE